MQSIKLINPDWSSDKVEKIIDKMIDKQIKNPKVIMDNNFTGEQKEASLISVFDWTFANKPIIAGNGTFYKNQYQALNPTANMLMDMLKTRKATKKTTTKTILYFITHTPLLVFYHIIPRYAS